MFRPASRLALRSSTPQYLLRPSTARRFLSTAPPAQKSRSWKNSTVRWGLAFGLVYYYNTSSLFAEEPPYVAPIPKTQHETEALPTLESITAHKQQRLASSQPSDASPAPPSKEQPTLDTIQESATAPGSPQELEEEADQQGAFNPETGEINWDCPCLGGMAHGPCGEQFKAAFSCFVYSKEEPKGMDCIDKFKHMQDCFRQHPDIYGSELDDDEAEAHQGLEGAPVEQPAAASASQPPSLLDMDSPQHGRGEKVADHKPNDQPDPEHVVQGKRERAENATEQVKKDHGPMSETPELVPRAAYSATSPSEDK